MQALRFTPGPGLEMVECAEPAPATGEVLVRVAAAGLCGTDVSVVRGAQVLDAAVILGHETCGTVVEVGPGVDPLHVGRRVVVSPIVVCGTCSACVAGAENLCAERTVIGLHRDGGLADLVAVPVQNALDLPAGVQPELGALCADAVATPFHALATRARLGGSEGIAVLGVGGLGQHAVQLARAMTTGPVVAVDVREEQLDLARLVGASAVVDARGDDLARRLVEAAGTWLDVVLDCAGIGATFAASLSALRPGGRAVRVAIEHAPLELTDAVGLVRSEITLSGSYGFTRGEVAAVLDMVADGRLDLGESVSHRIGLADVPRALDGLASGEPGYRRVVVTMPSTPAATA